MQKNLKLLGVIAILGATLAISGIAVQDAMAANSANKTSYQSMEMSVIMAGQSGLDATGNGTLAYASMKASNPQDVLILYDEVCTLYTEVQLKGGKKHDSDRDNFAELTDVVQATHTISLWIDGMQYREAITMCDRTYGIEANILSELEELCEVVANDPDTTADDELTCDPIFYRSWINTNSAHGWHWVVLNLGSEHDLNDDGIIDFEIRGNATVVDDGNLDTTGVAVGLRSLTVIPVHLDVGA